MKKMKMLTMSSVLLITVGLISCENEETKLNEETIQDKVTMSSPHKEPGISLIIVKFDLGRESKDCEGFGFCNVKWFPVFDKDQPIKDFMPTIPPPRNIASNSTVEARFSQENVKSNNELSFEIYFDRAVTDVIEPFVIDHDLKIVDLDKKKYNKTSNI